MAGKRDTERRQWKRFGTNLQGVIEFSDGEQWQVPVETLDLSVGGLCIHTGVALRAQDTFSYIFPDGEAWSAQVLRCEEVGGGFLVRAQFLDVGPEHLDAAMDYTLKM